MDFIAEWVINTIATYPELAVSVAAAWVLATAAVNFLRGKYGPDSATRPGWVNGTIAALDPFAGNFWKLFQRKAS